MKKLLGFIALAVVLFVLTSCGGSETNTYTVSFNVQGGSSVASVTLNEGETLNLSSKTSSKENFTFLGWSLTLNGNLVESVVVEQALTLYAVFSENQKFNISFKRGDTLLTVQSLYIGQTPSYSLTVNDTAEWDYTFLGWSLTQNGVVLNALPTASEDTTYYAIVSQVKKTYTVSFNTLGGSQIQNQTISYGEGPNLSVEPTKEGFRFLGWSLTQQGQLVDSVSVTGALTLYAQWIETIPLSDYLEALLGAYELNPMQFIPESLQPGGNEILASTLNYANFVDIEDIPYGGYGEQWQLVLDNLVEASYFFNILSVVDTLVSTSVVAYQNYIDQNPETDGSFEGTSSIYSYSIEFKDDVIYYVLSYSATLPVLGVQEVIIGISLNIETYEKTGFVQIGNTQSFAYEALEDSYTLALEYAGIRKSYLEVSVNDDDIYGELHEYLTIESVEIKSASQFYISDTYTQVVGNKASGLIGFTGIINETYLNETGELVGYEVNETLSILTYHTLWFNLSDLTGINSIKYTSTTINAMTEYTFYVNGSNVAFASKNVGGITNPKQGSRRFDIELRTMYFYVTVDNVLTKVSYQVPMLFVQEEVLSSLAVDITSVNNYLTGISLDISLNDLNSLMNAYDANVPAFKTYRDSVNKDMITTYLESIKSDF